MISRENREIYYYNPIIGSFGNNGKNFSEVIIEINYHIIERTSSRISRKARSVVLKT